MESKWRTIRRGPNLTIDCVLFKDSNTGKSIKSKTVSKEDKPDISYFANGVIGHKDAVFAQNDPELHRAYIRACSLVGNLALAYEATTLITNPTEKQKEFMGLVAYAIENPDAALKHFKDTEITSPAARLIYSSLLYNNGNVKPEDHISRLENDLNNSSAANTFMGILHFNMAELETKKDYFHFVEARNYFQKAINLAGESQSRLLNLLTAIYASGKHLEANSSARYLVTHGVITLDMAKIQNQFQITHIELPKININKSFYEIAKKLI